jgi:hypothetical protein
VCSARAVQGRHWAAGVSTGGSCMLQSNPGRLSGTTIRSGGSYALYCSEYDLLWPASGNAGLQHGAMLSLRIVGRYYP